jgi:tetratricopeptide (TPR) repeat protein
MRAFRSTLIASVLAFAFAFAPPAAAAAAAAPPSAADARAAATKLYRAGKFPAACEEFREASKLAPEDPAIAADVGLCLMKLGDQGAARSETLRAIRLARPGGPHDDAKTRKNAYYNLFVLGGDVRPPEVDACGPLDGPGGCDRPVFACVYRVRTAGAQEGENLVYASVALSADAAKPTCEEPPCETDERSAGADENEQKPVERGDALLSSEQWMTGAAAAMGGGEDLVNTGCKIVLADGCARVVATVCEDYHFGKKVGRAEADEIVLVAPKR